MENIIYQKYDTNSTLAENPHKIEFYCCQTNEVNPNRDIRELMIEVTDSKYLQINFSLDNVELKYLIKYLSDLLGHNEEFNKNSKPVE